MMKSFNFKFEIIFGPKKFLVFKREKFYKREPIKTKKRDACTTKVDFFVE